MQREIEIHSSKFNLFLMDEDGLIESIDDIQLLLLQTLEIIESEGYLKIPSDVSKFNINLALLGSQEIRDINKGHRGKDKETDVLSFPMQESLREDDFDIFNGEVEVGDILICHEVCIGQAKDFSITYNDEFIHLFVHGFLHVFGYDHELSYEEDSLMRGIEDRVLEKLKEKREL